MSDRASSRSGFLALLLVTGPVMALVNQEGIYSVAVWACGHHADAVIHVVPALCMAVVLAAVWMAISARSGIQKTNAILTSPRSFLAVSAATIGLFCAVVIASQWAAVFL